MKKLGDIIYKDANITQLLNVMERLDLEARNEVLRAINTRLTQTGKAKALRNIRKIIQSADPEIKKWLAKAIPKSYASGLSFADYQFSSIRLNSKLAKAILKDTILQVSYTNPKMAGLLKRVDAKNIYSYGDLYTKMGRAVKYNKVVMGDIRNHLQTRWKIFTSEPKIMKGMVGREFEKYKIKFTPAEIKIVRDLSIHSGTVEALLGESYLDFANSMNGLMRGAEQKLNEALRRQIRGKIIAKEITGKSIQKVKKEIVELLGDKGFNVLVDRGGRSWSLRRYSEMLARTHVIKASNEALINRAGQFGVDIVQVSIHAGACPICTPYEGKLYSISGDSKNYPTSPISIPIHPNCFDKDTEMLTAEGWKLIKDVKIDDEVISLNQKTFNLEKTKIIKTFKHKEKELIYFKNKIANIAVTGNHNMFYQSDSNRKLGKYEFKMIHADKLLDKKSGRFYASSKWENKDECSVEFARFMGIWLSEGSSSKVDTSYLISISQSKTKNPKKYSYMLKAIKAFTKNKLYLNDESIRFRDKKLGEYLKQFGKSANKFIPNKIKNSSRGIIEEFLYTFNLGDGSKRKSKQYKGGNLKDEITYITSSKKMADDIGELILKVGKRPSYYLMKSKGKNVKFKNGTYTINNNQWVIRQNNHKHISLSNMKIEKKEYNDFVYCVELEKNNTLYTRRNGKCIWVGNCRHVWLMRPDLK